MARGVQTQAKRSFKKRSPIVDSKVRPSKDQILTFNTSKLLPSTSCISNLFSDLSVSRAQSKRVWGGITSRRKRSACLASLVKQDDLNSLASNSHSSSSSSSHGSIEQKDSTAAHDDTTTRAQTPTQGTEQIRGSDSDRDIGEKENHQQQLHSPVTVTEKLSWGFFVEPDQHQLHCQEVQQ